ncbi:MULTISPECIES: MerR family transcriptional regulator [Gracilibacillus]|uniref:MerR family DNA-binding transcriptional regulator n=1 Tax=Gracilibacillus dipsosauri TaxID=178340 RepID=A0A317L3G6_9BACI|nr:MerR family transcriptional regulator [Gracilibacillus dipsosauri]PWU70421.1 MerR family DNA-binding transcriptional regulator [Gracilibacillus dipsosauri]
MLSIGQVAEKVGVNTSALRYYEQIGLIPNANRVNGKREYSSEIIGRIQVIKLAQSAGFQIDEIKILLEGFDSNISPSERWKAMATKKKSELQDKINQLKVMQSVLDNSLKCSCLSWEECFKNIEIPAKKV